MSGGGGSSGTQAAAPAAAPMQPLEQTQYDTSLGTGAMTPVPQTYTQAGKPSWMTGQWDMPSWGKDAATGAPLDQAALSGPGQSGAPAASAGESSGLTAADVEAMIKAAGLGGAQEKFNPSGNQLIDDLILDAVNKGGLSMADANASLDPIRAMQQSMSKYQVGNDERTWTSD